MKKQSTLIYNPMDLRGSAIEFINIMGLLSGPVANQS